MRNKQIKNLLKVVPVKIRLEVYEAAIESIKNKTPVTDDGGYGLCIILPCILWGLKSVIGLAPDKDDWDFHDTGIAFPELTEDRLDELSYYSDIPNRTLNSVCKNDKRIELLREFINEIKQDGNKFN